MMIIFSLASRGLAIYLSLWLTFASPIAALAATAEIGVLTSPAVIQPSTSYKRTETVNVAKKLGGIEAIKRNPKLLESYLGVSLDDFKSSLGQMTAGSITPTRVFRLGVKDRGELDSRVKASRKKAAASSLLSSLAASASSSGVGLSQDIKTVVGISKSGATDLSTLVIPRLAATFIENFLKDHPSSEVSTTSTQTTWTGVDPVFPDEQSNSKQSLFYKRSSSSSPSPGTLSLNQDKTDLVYDLLELDCSGWPRILQGTCRAIWVDYNVNMEDLAIDLPINSKTFDVSFQNTDEMKTKVDLSDFNFNIKFGGKLGVSATAQGVFIAGGVIVTTLLALVSPVLAAFFWILISSIELLANNWLYATATIKGVTVNDLTLKLDKTSNALFVKDVDRFSVSVGSITAVGADFTTFLNTIVKLFSGKVGHALGLEGTDLDSCTSLSNCASRVVENYFLRGDIASGSDENCWKTNASGSSEFKTSPKSAKCQMIASVNSGLAGATTVSLPALTPGAPATASLAMEKAGLKVINDELLTKWSLTPSLNVGTSRGACVASLPAYARIPGSPTSYTLDLKGDLDVFLPIDKIEEIIHQYTLKGDYCSQTTQTVTDSSGQSYVFTFAPTGQFEIDPSPVLLAGASGMSALGGSSSSSSSSSSTLSPSSAQLAFWMRAPLAITVLASAAGGLIKIAATLNATAEILARVSSDCSEGAQSLTIIATQGKVTGLTGNLSTTTPLGTTNVACSNTACPLYTPLNTGLNTAFNTQVQGMPAVPLPTLQKILDTGLYLSLDTLNTKWIDDVALRLPLEITTVNPCSTPPSSGGGSCGTGTSGTCPGGTIPGLGGTGTSLPGGTSTLPTSSTATSSGP